MKASIRKLNAGKEGEQMVSDELLKIDKLRIITGLTYEFISAFQNSSHQIDFVLITTKNIYLIEVKSYKTILDYDFAKESWTLEYHRTGYKDRRRNGIDNPILQNRNHRLSFLSKTKIIDTNHVLAVSVVISNSDLLNGKKWKMLSKTDFLVNINHLVEFVKACDERCANLIGIDNVIQELDDLTPVDWRKHVNYCRCVNEVKKILKKNKNASFEFLQFQEKMCCKCGERMYIRHGKNSIFWGCSTYPQCTFTESIV